MLHSYISRTAPEFVWKWTYTPWKGGFGSACWVRNKVQMPAFTLNQMNHINRVIVLIDSEQSSVNSLRPEVNFQSSFQSLIDIHLSMAEVVSVICQYVILNAAWDCRTETALKWLCIWTQSVWACSWLSEEQSQIIHRWQMIISTLTNNFAKKKPTKVQSFHLWNADHCGTKADEWPKCELEREQFTGLSVMNMNV